MTTTAEQQRPTQVPPAWRTRLARVFTELFAPWVLIIVLFLAVGWYADGGRGLAWGLLGACFASVGPMLVIVGGVIAGRYTDHHLTVRQHRILPLALSVLLVVAGIVVLAAAGAPADVVATEAAMLGGLVVTAPITAVWKVSFHTGVASAAVVILAIVSGPAWAVATVLVAAIGWSRVQLGHHTAVQVIAGAPIGAVAATLPFLLAR